MSPSGGSRGSGGGNGINGGGGGGGGDCGGGNTKIKWFIRSQKYTTELRNSQLPE